MENPYSAPSANLFGSTGSPTEPVPLDAVTPMQRTKVWVRLVSVALWLFSAILVLGGISSGFVVFLATKNPDKMPLGMPEFWILIGAAVGYFLMGIVYIFPAIKLWAYSSRINRLVASRSMEDLISALEQQRSFWKFTGIVTLLVLMFTIFLMIAGVAGAWQNGSTR